MIEAILADLRKEVDQSIIAARFHNALVEAIISVARHVVPQRFRQLQQRDPCALVVELAQDLAVLLREPGGFAPEPTPYAAKLVEVARGHLDPMARYGE